MKKLVLISCLLVLVLILLGGFYAGSSWYLGKKIQENSSLIIKNIQKSADKNGWQWDFASYERHLLSTQIDVLVSVPVPNVEKPVLFARCNVRLNHGPFLGWRFGLFSTNSRCWYDAESPANTDLNGLAFLKEKTYFNFDGSFRGKIKNPKSDETKPTGSDLSSLWQGCVAKYDYHSDSHLLNSTSKCEGGEIKKTEGDKVFQFIVGAFEISSQSYMPELTKGIFNAEKFKMELKAPGEIIFNIEDKKIVVQDILLEQEGESANELFNGHFKLSLQKIKANDQEVGPGYLDLSFENIPEMAKDQLQKGNVPLAMHSLQDKLASLPTPPHFSVDRLRLEEGSDYFELKLKVGLGESNTAQGQPSPELAGQFMFTPPFATKLISLSVANPLAKIAALAQIPQQISAGKQTGFLIEDGPALKLVMSYKEGKIMINGRVIDVPLTSMLSAFGGFGAVGALEQDPSAPAEESMPEPGVEPDSVESELTAPAVKEETPPENAPQPEPTPQPMPSPVAPPVVHEAPQANPQTKNKTSPAAQPNYFKQDR